MPKEFWLEDVDGQGTVILRMDFREVGFEVEGRLNWLKDMRCLVKFVDDVETWILVPQSSLVSVN